MEHLRRGAQKFSKHVFHWKKGLFEELSKGQAPEVLFITCADSRIDPALITQQEPGRLFIVRNAGNIVPPYGTPVGGSQSTIEFAVQAVKVKHIVVCGHSSCGAMGGLLNPSKLDNLPMVREWVEHASELRDRLPNDVSVDEAAQANVLLQLEHLMEQPYVRTAVEEGRVTLHGWFYDIATGTFSEYNDQTECFETLGPDPEPLTAAAPLPPKVATKTDWSLAALWNHYRPNFGSDFLASLVVFLVALPLCIGIANASGVPPVAGLITGIVGGILVGFCTGSPLQVSGPAAGLIVTVYELVSRLRKQFLVDQELTEATPELLAVAESEATIFAVAGMGLAVALAGIVQMVAGTFRLGQWFRAVAPAVVEGMLAGIGVLIILSQFYVMLDRPSHGEGLENIKGLWPEVVNFFPIDGDHHHIAATTGMLTIVLIMLWNRFAPKKISFIPAALVGVVGATVFTELMEGFDPSRLDVPDNFFASLVLPEMSRWTTLLQGDSLSIIITGALVIALVASAETLLCATAVDQMHTGPRTRYDREMIAQGVGNTAAGLLGGLPMTGVIVRSSANVKSGAKTNLSAILHGFWLLLFVATLPWVLRYIPEACLGGLLVYTGFKLVNFKNARHLWNTNPGEFVIYLVTLVTIVCTDLLTGVIVGTVLAAARLLWRFTHLEIEIEPSDRAHHYVMRLAGAATFLRLPYFAEQLERIPGDASLHLDLDHLHHIDHACLELLANWSKQHESQGGTIVIDWGRLDESFRQSPQANLANLRNRVAAT